MGKTDELTLDEFYDRTKKADIPKSHAMNMLKGSNNYERTKGYRGHPVMIKRKL